MKKGSPHIAQTWQKNIHFSICQIKKINFFKKKEIEKDLLRNSKRIDGAVSHIPREESVRAVGGGGGQAKKQNRQFQRRRSHCGGGGRISVEKMLICFGFIWCFWGDM